MRRLRGLCERMGRGAAALLLVSMGAGFPAGAETIFFEQGDNGALRLTNAPASADLQTYLSRVENTPRRPLKGPYARQIGSVSKQYGIDPELVRAIISTESNFDPRAVSPKGARGLMQLMPSTAARFGVENIHDPLENIQGGVRYFRHLLDLFQGDLVLALAAYNAGEGIVQRRGRVPNYPETQEYIRKVLKRYDGDPVAAARPSRSSRRGSSSEQMPARKKIYRTVSKEGVLVFSDVPVRGQARN